MNEKLAEKLINMMEEDQRLLKEEKLTDEIRDGHTEELNEIVGEYGWPTISLVGKRASHAAWLITQHSDGNVDFQEKCLELLKEAAEREEATKQDVAYLTDRVRRNRGRPQVFGTQLKYNEKEGKFGSQPIEDPDNVNKRRKEYEMDPLTLEEYLEWANRIRKDSGEK